MLLNMPYLVDKMGECVLDNIVWMFEVCVLNSCYGLDNIRGKLDKVIKIFIVLMGECMILDYNQYIKESGKEGIVNFTKVKNALENLQIKSGYCPFGKKRLKIKCIINGIIKLDVVQLLSMKLLYNDLIVDGGNILILFKVMI